MLIKCASGSIRIQLLLLLRTRSYVTGGPVCIWCDGSRTKCRPMIKRPTDESRHESCNGKTPVVASLFSLINHRPAI